MKALTNKFETGLICLTCLSSHPATLSAQQNKNLPNIVMVLADDMGIGDLGCYGSTKIKTPNIDALAQQGLVFTNHYSGSTVSAPSRCCLLTGKHTGHAYVRGNKGVDLPHGRFDLNLPDEEVTVAELLKQKGYATMCVGKWGLGGPGTSGSPMNQGFDYFCGYLSQAAAHRYYPQYIYENEEKMMLNGEVYSHFRIMDRGLDFIRRHKGQPVFAYFAITPPHADLDYPDLGDYADAFEETPFVNNGPGFHSQPKPKAAYAAMVSEVDSSVGRIVDLLKAQGMWDNTIFIFSSDNGVHFVGGHQPDFFNSNGPFRGYKRDLYEGGVRCPFIVNWPGVINSPRVTDNISTFWDFLPTVADIIGAEVPQGIDGLSYLPVLKGENRNPEQHDCIYYEFYEQRGKQSVLKDGWKLVRLNVSQPNKLKEELYYLPYDQGETMNLASRYPDKVKELRELCAKNHTESKHFSWKRKK